MTGGRGRRGQVPNEEVPYHERIVQAVMIEDLRRQVVKSTQHLAEQNLEMYHCIAILTVAIQNPITRTCITSLFWFKNNVFGMSGIKT